MATFTSRARTAGNVVLALSVVGATAAWLNHRRKGHERRADKIMARRGYERVPEQEQPVVAGRFGPRVLRTPTYRPAPAAPSTPTAPSR